MDKFIKLKNNSDVKLATWVVLGAILTAISVVWVLDLGNFFSTGVTGVCQIINRALKLVSIKGSPINISVGILMFAFNIPLFIIGARAVSKRFAIYSGLSVVLQSVLIVLFEYLRDVQGINPFASLDSDRLLLAILGGLIGGVASGITLKAGASSGGVEIVSQYFFIKKHMPFTKVTFSIDGFIFVCGFFLESLEAVVYTVVRLIIYLIVIDKMYTIYKYVQINIITTKVEEMREALLNKFNHGITIFQARGGYTNQEKSVIEVVASSYEIEEYRRLALEIDEHSFIIYSSISKIDGLFNRNIIT